MKKVHVSLATRLVGITIALLGFGLIMIYSASVAEAAKAFGNKWYFVLLQVKWAVAGLLAMFVVSRLPTRLWERFAPLLMGAGVALLLAVLIPGIGSKVQGARRWIALPGVTLQPAELIKFVEVVYLSSWLGKRKVTFVQFGFLVAALAGLIMLEPDMGTMLVVTSLAIAVYFVNGYPFRSLLVIAAAGAVAVLGLILVEPYRMARLTTFLNPNADTQGASYHIHQVLLALGSGGISGVGIGRSRQKYQYLPEATTDSIFAVTGEELGFVGGCILIGAFIYFLSLSFKIAASSRNQFNSSLAAGMGAWFGIQVFLNLAAMVAFAPLTGVPLPLVSYGGSSLVTMLMGVGVILGVAREEKI